MSFYVFMYLAMKLALEKWLIMLKMSFPSRNVIKQYIWWKWRFCGNALKLCKIHKNYLVMYACPMLDNLLTNAQIWILSLSIQAYLSETFLHLWSILGKRTEGCWFTVQQCSSSSGTCVSLFGVKRQTLAHSNSSALTIYLQLGQGRVSGLFPNLPEWVWLNACLRKPAVPWALHGVIIRAVSHDSRLSWNVYPKAWQSLCCMTRDAFQRRCYSSNTNRMSFHPFSHA